MITGIIHPSFYFIIHSTSQTKPVLVKDFEGKDERVSDSEDSDCLSTQFPILSVLSKKSSSSPLNIQSKTKKWNKTHSCLFCKKMVIKMARHLELKHSNETCVSQILALPKGSKIRRRSWLKMINNGDYNHNYDVLEKGVGTVIPKYRGKNSSVDGLRPCSNCNGMYRKSKLSVHVKSCNPLMKNKSCRAGALLLPVPKQVSKSLWSNVVLKMNEDEIGRKARNDSLIIAFGERMYNKQDISEHTPGHVSGKMRELSRLLLDLEHNSNGDIKTLRQALNVKHFDQILNSVRHIAEYSDVSHSFKKPSVAIRLGYSVKKCATIMKSQAIQQGDKVQIENADNFLSLLTGNWSDHISTSAHTSLEKDKFNKPQVLPTCQDVHKLYSYVKNIEADDYTTLAKAAICEISLFNRKRGGEVQRMTIEDFEKGKRSQGSVDDEIIQSLSPVERKLADALTRIEIRGKFCRRVAILLNDSMMTKLEKLLILRESLSIKGRYVFTTLNGERPYRGCDILRDMVVQAGVNNPDNFTWTALRKQVATISQTLAISESEQDQLAQFLGHDIRVHREYYRLPHDIIQKTKVGQILSRANAGEDASIDPFSWKDDDTSSDQSDIDDHTEAKRTTLLMEDTNKKGTDFKGITNISSVQTGATNKKSKTGATNKRRSYLIWTEKERNAVLKHFRVFITMKKLPRKGDIETVLKTEECLRERSWKNVKDFCYNEIKKR